MDGVSTFQNEGPELRKGAKKMVAEGVVKCKENARVVAEDEGAKATDQAVPPAKLSKSAKSKTPSRAEIVGSDVTLEILAQDFDGFKVPTIADLHLIVDRLNLGRLEIKKGANKPDLLRAMVKRAKDMVVAAPE
ncbi:hypothetical protein P7C70_g9049, partial [Phenoliferia sp. Uapishka_3]